MDSAALGEKLQGWPKNPTDPTDLSSGMSQNPTPGMSYKSHKSQSRDFTQIPQIPAQGSPPNPTSWITHRSQPRNVPQIPPQECPTNSTNPIPGISHESHKSQLRNAPGIPQIPAQGWPTNPTPGMGRKSHKSHPGNVPQIPQIPLQGFHTNPTDPTLGMSHKSHPTNPSPRVSRKSHNPTPGTHSMSLEYSRALWTQGCPAGSGPFQLPHPGIPGFHRNFPPPPSPSLLPLDFNPGQNPLRPFLTFPFPSIPGGISGIPTPRFPCPSGIPPGWDFPVFFPSYYDTKAVLLCLGITALVCLGISILSFQSKLDFTSCQGILAVLLLVLLLGGILLGLLLPSGYVPWLHGVYALLGALVFSLFLALDTQLLLGTRRYSLNPEEFVFGALNIYLDIIHVFSFLLQFLGSSRE